MSYMGTHNKVRNVKGSASGYACVRCQEQAREWALLNESPRVEFDAQGRRFSRELDDYVPMCFHCHRLYDKERITHCPQGHPYAGDNLLIDAGKRKCRTCVYSRNRTHKPTAAQQARRTELQRIRRAKAKEGLAS